MVVEEEDEDEEEDVEEEEVAEEVVEEGEEDGDSCRRSMASCLETVVLLYPRALQFYGFLCSSAK